MNKTIGRFLGGTLVCGVVLAMSACGGRTGRPFSGSPGSGDSAVLPVTQRIPAILDDDRDGVDDGTEAALGLDPHSFDTDHDGLTDHYELWGCEGLAVGVQGDLARLPDVNGNGVVAALDSSEAGLQILKNASATLATQRVPAIPPEDSSFTAEDMDGDGVPNDFELFGFYIEIDDQYQPWLVKWDGQDYRKKYFKTDPTKWSTDGDPFSDWEESTKINLDQRVKIPGDHPCIPAYPDLHMVLSNYTITLNQDVSIESSNGNSTEKSWTNGLDTTWTQETEHNSEAAHGGWGEIEVQFVNPLEGSVGGGYQGKWNVTDSTNTETSSVVKTENSGMTAQEWSTAQQVGGNSLQAAFVNLNFDMVNTGTLPASNVVAVANFRLGDSVIWNTLIGNGENGELPGRSAQVLTLQASTTGRATPDHPTGENLMLTMNQLRSLQSGAPLSCEVVSFQADTLVWQVDPETGRRLFLTMGEWSPYQNAIQNTSARLVLDFRDDPTGGTPLFQNLPVKRVEDLRIACFPSNGTYFGSPPPVNLLDAFLWAFEMENSDVGPVITIRDGISDWKHTSNIVNWEFSFDQDIADKILSDPQKYANVFQIPLEPGNPSEHIYTCSAPPSGELAKPKIYWALCDPQTRKLRAYSRDVRGIREMRFKSDPDAPYLGELMPVGYDPTDPEMSFFYTYEVPAGYFWTGREEVVALNLDDKETTLPVQILGSNLGFLTGSGEYGMPWTGIGTNQHDLNFNDGISLNPPADIRLKQEYAGTSLKLTYTPQSGQLHDALFVVDGVDTNGNPVYVIDYNYLRKQDYAATAAVETIAATATPDPPLVHTYGIRSSNGTLAVLKPHLITESTASPYKWKVDKLVWRTYEGM
jgi:hypothetical protein